MPDEHSDSEGHPTSGKFSEEKIVFRNYLIEEGEFGLGIDGMVGQASGKEGIQSIQSRKTGQNQGYRGQGI